MHILRHTFCSHLAMRGAPARAIQELAGHADLTTTQRYMHLSPAALDSAIRLLDQPFPYRVLETFWRRGPKRPVWPWRNRGGGGNGGPEGPYSLKKSGGGGGS